MNNTIIDINNYDKVKDKIVLSKKMSYENTSKYFIYSYDDNTENLNNLLLKIPPIRLLYNYSNQNFNQINFPLNPTYSKTKKFTHLISTIENSIQESLNKPKLEWITNLKKVKNIKNIKLNYFGKNDVKIVTSEKNIQEIKDFESGAEVEIIVHLSHIWLKENRVGISYDICQIKYTNLKSMLNQNLFGETNVTKQYSQRSVPTPPEIPDIKVTSRRHTLIPSVSMLEDQKSKLRKTSLSKK